MENNTQCVQQGTIDLRELFAVLKRRKMMIGLMTASLTILAIIYAYIIAKPVYSGSVTLEIGQVVNEEFNQGKYSSLKIRNLDDVNNLKNIVSSKFGISASVIKKTTLLTYSAADTNKDTIKENLKKAVDFTIQRHKEKAKLYSGLHAKINMTQLLDDITVGDAAVKPKKKLIIVVAFITGLMLSVFLAFFLEFIAGMKKPEEN